MKKLNVMYNGWGKAMHYGTLAEKDQKIYFEYTTEALKSVIQLSPIQTPLSAGLFHDFPNYQDNLPGFIADSLPDGYRISHLPFEQLLLLTLLQICGRNRRQQSSGIGMNRIAKQLSLRSILHHFSHVHYHNIIADMTNHAKVMGNKHIGKVFFRL